MPLVPTNQPPADSDHFGSLRNELTPFEPLSVLSACGALQLLPQNGNRLWRLEALATLGQGSARGDRHPRAADLRRFLNEGQLGAVAAQQEDLYDDLLVEELAFHLGSYRIGAGLAEDGVPVLRLVIRAVLLTDILPRETWTARCQTAVAALHLSDYVLRAARLARNAVPAQTSDRLAHVPGASRLAGLRSLVTYTDDNLREAAGTADLGALAPLTAEVGKNFSADAILARADRWPLTHCGEMTVVAKPFGIAVALRHHLVSQAVAAAGAERVAEAFGDAVDRDCRDTLNHLNVRVETTPRTVERPWTMLKSEIDAGLQQVCLVVTDPFTSVSPNNPYSSWGAETTIDAAHAELERIASGTNDEILGIIVAQGAGGGAFLGTHATDVANLRRKTLTACDLQVISFLETEDPLSLWKWTRAADELSKETHVVSFSAVDSYAIYRRDERSYAPHREATMLSVLPGTGGELRQRAKRQRDLHGVKFVDGSIREVRRTGEDQWDPAPYHLVDLPDRLILLVDGLPLPVWVTGPAERVLETWDLVHSVAYWVAELGVPLRPLLEQLAIAPCVALEIDALHPDFWWRGGDDPGGDEPAQRSAAKLTATIHFGAAVARLLTEPDNRADRMMAAEIAHALNDIARGLGEPGVSDEAVACAVGEAAPLGLKKHLIHLRAAGNETLEEPAGPPRGVQETDVTRARERLAEHLQSFGWRGEPVPHERRDEVLKSAVNFLFKEACAVIDRASASGLLEWLVEANERIIAVSEHRQAILPARLETYPQSESELRDEVATDNQAGICCRFLIEYAAACPPTVSKSWSLRDYDEAMGIAAEMIAWAYFDDAVVGGLTTADLLINGEGQLRRIELDRYEQGRATFFTGRVAAGRAASASLFPQRFVPAVEARDMDPTLARLDAPLKAEAGIGIHALIDLLHTATGMAREKEAQVMQMRLSDAAGAFADRLSEPREDIERAIDYLALGPRERFLPPPSARYRDALPSRFARRWSYTRRPFIRIETNDGDEIMWGRRHPLMALRLIVGQLLSGRYQDLAEGAALRAELGRVAHETGHQFEHDVAETFRDAGLAARENVTALGGDSLKRVDGRDLGDIDVLAAQRGARTLWIVECKDLTGALTPGEVVDEMSEHFGESETASVARVEARRAWVGERRDAALRELGITDSAARWRTKAVIVTGDAVMAPLIRDLPVAVVASSELPRWIAEQGVRAKRDARRKRRGRRGKR